MADENRQGGDKEPSGGGDHVRSRRDQHLRATAAPSGARRMIVRTFLLHTSKTYDCIAVSSRKGN